MENDVLVTTSYVMGVLRRRYHGLWLPSSSWSWSGWRSWIWPSLSLSSVPLFWTLSAKAIMREGCINRHLVRLHKPLKHLEAVWSCDYQCMSQGFVSQGEAPSFVLCIIYMSSSSPWITCCFKHLWRIRLSKSTNTTYRKLQQVMNSFIFPATSCYPRQTCNIQCHEPTMTPPRHVKCSPSAVSCSPCHSMDQGLS